MTFSLVPAIGAVASERNLREQATKTHRVRAGLIRMPVYAGWTGPYPSIGQDTINYIGIQITIYWQRKGNFDPIWSVYAEVMVGCVALKRASVGNKKSIDILSRIAGH